MHLPMQHRMRSRLSNDVFAIDRGDGRVRVAPRAAQKIVQVYPDGRELGRDYELTLGIAGIAAQPEGSQRSANCGEPKALL